MVAREKKTRSEEDMISQLPDHLLCHLLTHLSTKDSVRTSVLSKRWRTLWQHVPKLELDSDKFSDCDTFGSFADKFFDIDKDSWIQKLCLKIDESYDLTPWIDYVTTHKIQHLDIGILRSSHFHKIPLLPKSLYTCETLVYLRLHQVVLVDAEFFSLPCVKVIKLTYVRYLNVACLEKLISASPVLEDLSMMALSMALSSEKEDVLQVRSQSLKRIYIDDKQVVIDAPLLQCLRTRFDLTKNYKSISSKFLTKVDIHFGWLLIDPNNLVIRDILQKISRVRDLTISSYSPKFIVPNSGQMIQFCYLSRLQATLYANSNLEKLPNLLECCPKLESLMLEWFEEPFTILSTKSMMFSTVPLCLVSSLKFVELKSYVKKYSEELGELMNVARYFLKNSTNLKKFSVRFYQNYMKTGYEILVREQLVAMPRCSSTCQILVL